MRLIDADALHYIMEDTEKPKQMDNIRRFMVDKAPTVDAEPIRHGHWDSRQLVYECSECGHMGYSDMNYCPNCGALMDEEVEE